MLGFVQAEGLCEFGEVLAGVVKVYDVDGPGKMGCGDGFIIAGPVGADLGECADEFDLAGFGVAIGGLALRDRPEIK